MTLMERLDARLAELQSERQRIQERTARDVASVDARLEAVIVAKRAITPAVETAYATLRTLGLFTEF